MAQRDDKTLTKFVPTSAGATIDTKDFNSCTIVLTSNIIAGAAAITLQDSPDGINWTAVADIYRVNDPRASDFTPTPGAGVVANDPAGAFSVGYVGMHRYVRFAATGAALSDSGATFGAILGQARVAPVLQTPEALAQ
jgi:hypothetical protein